ncbi:MAG: hypothetical protein WBA74_26735 [Cyclobacteriaceae bacterium]
MIALFRINDPYRLVLVLLILVGLRMPFLLEDILPTIPQFRWMLIGERLAEGSFLYRDIYDFTAPFAAFVFQMMHHLFGRSLMASAIMAIVLVLIQSVIFNNLLLSSKTYNEGTYLPAYCYAVFMSVHYDFLVLSPALLSLTFVLLALSNIFKRIDNQTKDELFLNTGIYLGIAAMFYLPSAILFLTFLIILIIYSNSLVRRLLMMTIGFVMIILIVTLYYFRMDAVSEFYNFFLNSLWTYKRLSYYSGWMSLVFLAFPLMILVIAVFYLQVKGKFANYQIKFQQAMLFLLAGSMLMLAFVKELAYFNWVFMIPAVAFFTVHLLLTIRVRIAAEFLNIIILIAVFVLADISYDWSLKKEASYFMTEETPAILQNRKILVLGDNLSFYRSAKSATPYVNWRISKQLYSETAYYDNLLNIIKAFEKDPPDIVFDSEGLFPNVQEKIPLLMYKYQPVPNYPGYYRNISN